VCSTYQSVDHVLSCRNQTGYYRIDHRHCLKGLRKVQRLHQVFDYNSRQAGRLRPCYLRCQSRRWCWVSFKKASTKKRSTLCIRLPLHGISRSKIPNVHHCVPKHPVCRDRPIKSQGFRYFLRNITFKIPAIKIVYIQIWQYVHRTILPSIAIC